MKKILALVLAFAMVFSLAACGSKNESTPEVTTKAPETTQAPETEAPTEPEVPAMSYKEFTETALKEPVIIEAYVQGKQAYYAAKQTACLYLADQDGAYFCYNAALTQEQYDQLTPGTKVRVSGDRDEYAGEVEVSNGVVEKIIKDDVYEAAFADVTDLIGRDELAERINGKVSFTNLVIVPQKDGEAISKKESDSDPDIYFSAANENGTVNFCVESYLTGKDTDTYKAVEALKAGDIVTVTGFLYWYNGANPHVTGVEVTGSVNDKSEGVMTYEEFMAASADTADPVVIEAYVQGKQAYYAAKQTANLYLADADGAYYCYGCSMTQEQYDQLEAGTKVRVSGEKAAWAGEVEVGEGGVLEEILGGFKYIAEPRDITVAVGLDEVLEVVMNQKVGAYGLVVMPQDDGSAVSKKDNDSDPDLYFRAAGEYGMMDLCVESYLTGPDTEAYKTAEALKVGDVIDVEAFLYWYNGANPHVTAVTVKGNINEKSEGVMTYEEFLATSSETLDPVVIEAYVQGKQAYYEAKGTANLYLADADGAYYCYGVSLTKEEYDKLEEGTKVKISGERLDYQNEIEIQNGKLEEIQEGSYIAAPVSIYDAEDTEALKKLMNRKVVFKNMVVMPQESGDAVDHKQNDSDPDLYIAADNGTGKVNFCVESYLTGSDTDAYKAAEGLELGDKVDILCFLYWWQEGPNPHIIDLAYVID